MTTFRRVAVAVALIGSAGAPLRAQSSPSSEATARTLLPLVEITPYAGYVIASDLLSGPLGTSVSTGNAPLYGAQLSVPLLPYLAAVGNVAYSKSDLRIGLPLVGGVGVGDAVTWLYDGGLQLSTPALARGHGALVPFAQLGVGAVNRAIGVSGLTTHATNLAWNAGVGADFSLGRSIGLRVLAKDYVGKFDVREATGLDVEPKTTHSWALTAGLKVAF